jgi:5-amino-6-(5-phosphoribosylamino)uracil reductase/diaminohydroxyphosphoribosylaminopyrimidine deaminase/5-amino-6-(5-phosphoribosylamino)uracil reductase
LRARHAAIMVGAGTILADDPRLTVRLAQGPDPLRVVVDSSLRTPLTAAVLADGAAHGTLLAVTERAPAERQAAARALGATILPLPPDAAGRVDLHALLAALRDRGIDSVMVEGGAGLITSLLCERLASRLAVCIAPKILGAGIEAIGDLGIDALNAALRLDELSVERCGPDLIVTGRILYPEATDG